MVKETLDSGGESITPPDAETSGLPGAGGQYSLTRTLLACGVVAGPLYIVVGVIQMLIRPGFDIRRHELSLMSNGDLGWIQISNLVLTGLKLFHDRQEIVLDCATNTAVWKIVNFNAALFARRAQEGAVNRHFAKLIDQHGQSAIRIFF